MRRLVLSAELERSSNRRWAFSIFLVCALSYSYFYQAGGWNQNSRFDLVRALVEDQTASIDRFHRNTGDKGCRGPAGRCERAKPGTGQHYYCDKAPGVSLLGAIAYAPVHWLAGPSNGNASKTYLRWSSHWVTIAVIAIPSAISVAFLMLLLVELGSSRVRAVAVALSYGFATLALPYSTLLYGHQLSAALVVIGLYWMVLAWSGKLGAADAVRMKRSYAGAGVLFGFAVGVEYPAALAVLALSTWAIWRARKQPRAAVALVVGGLIGGLAMFLYHWLVFGNPLTLPYEFVLMPERHQGAFMGIGSLSKTIVWKVTFSAYRGLFFSAPWLLLAAVGAVFWWRRNQRGLVIACSAIFALFVVLNGSVAGWHGGWTFGARYLIPAVPFLALLVAGALEVGADRPGRVATMVSRVVVVAFVVLSVYSARNMVAATAVRPEVPQHIKRPFADFVDKHFAAGQLALNRQGIDDKAPRPGAKPEAFNLGMTLGLKGKASLLPLGLGLLLIFGWRHRDDLEAWLRARGQDS